MYTHLSGSTLEMTPGREKKGEFGREQLCCGAVPIKVALKLERGAPPGLYTSMLISYWIWAERTKGCVLTTAIPKEGRKQRLSLGVLPAAGKVSLLCLNKDLSSTTQHPPQGERGGERQGARGKQPNS